MILLISSSVNEAPLRVKKLLMLIEVIDEERFMSMLPGNAPQADAKTDKGGESNLNEGEEDFPADLFGGMI